MKPYVIFIKENGELNLTQDELKEMIQEAYEQGYQDGSKQTITVPAVREPLTVSNHPDIAQGIPFPYDRFVYKTMIGNDLNQFDSVATSNLQRNNSITTAYS